MGFIVLCFHQAFSQKQGKKIVSDLDTNYVHTYYNDLIIRAYSVNKNNFIQLNDIEQDVRVKYRTNDFYNLGVGLNYKWFGLNIGTKIPFLSLDDDRFGKTTYFGLQSYLYARKFTLDVLALKTRGYYLSSSNNKDLSPNIGEIYYQRRDLATKNFGVNFNYILNYRRFSYKAAFKQNALQKKSAGSVFFGAGIYQLTVDADSAIVPRETDEKYFEGWSELDAFQSATININLGYAYSYVPLSNWIITGSYKYSLGLQQNIWHVEHEGNMEQFKLSTSGTVRISAGHHFSNFYLGATFVHYQQNSTMQIHSLKILNGTNYTEFTISKRIKL